MVWVAHTQQGAHAPCTSRALACPVPALFKTGKCRESSSWCVGTVDPQDVGRTEESVNLTNVGLTDVPTPTKCHPIAMLQYSMSEPDMRKKPRAGSTKRQRGTVVGKEFFLMRAVVAIVVE